ncbi:MAG: aminomethyl-transferring glycine dehydrogenase subunit GcvPB, partial [Rhodobiaceae bacterium]|nr:aminomethyl-transferring glycine dehydrogenase subunit GcvPB [Rhodobiaceae bacterium]
TMRDLVKGAKEGDMARFKNAPELAPRRRLDETQAARNPILRWHEPKLEAQAAE